METIITAFITFILGYVAGIYLPLRFRREDKKPVISISPFQERHNYFDITNHGGDILNLKIIITWLQEGTKQTRALTDFFTATEDPVTQYPHNSSTLKKGETKKVTNCPLFSDNAEIEVNVSGTDVSGTQYEKQFTLKNKIK